MARQITVTLSVAEADRFMAQLRQAGVVGGQVFESFEKAARRVNETAPAVNRTGQAFEFMEGRAKGAVRGVRDAVGTLELLAPLGIRGAESLTGLARVVGNVGDAFGLLAGIVARNPIIAAVTVVAGLAATFYTLARGENEATKAAVSYQEAMKKAAEVTQTATERSAALAAEKRREAAETIKATLAVERENVARLEAAKQRQQEIVRGQAGLNAARRARGQAEIPTESPELDTALRDARGRVGNLETSLADIARGGGAARETTAKLTEDLDRLRAELDPAAEAAQKYQQQLVLIYRAYEAGQISSEEYRLTLGRITAQFEGADVALKKRLEEEAKFWQANDDAARAGAEAYDRLIQKQRERQAQLSDYLGKLESEAQLSAETNKQREIGRAIREAELKLTDEMGRKTRELSDEERRRVETAVETRIVNEEAARAADQALRDYQRNAERVLDNIARAGGDVLFEQWEDDNADFWESVERLGKRTIANLAAEWATQQFLRPLLFGNTQPQGGASSSGGIMSLFGGGGGGFNPLSFLNMGGSSGSGGGMFGGLGNIFSSLFGSAAGSSTAAAAASTATAAQSAGGLLAGGGATSLATASGATAGSLGGGLTAAMSAIPVWGWIALAASTAKRFTTGAKPNSARGVANTLLMPSIEEWMANPVRSFGNVVDPAGTIIADFVGKDNPIRYLSPGGLFAFAEGDVPKPYAGAGGSLRDGRFKVSTSTLLDEGNISGVTSAVESIANALNQLAAAGGGRLRGGVDIFAASGRHAGDFELSAVGPAGSGIGVPGKGQVFAGGAEAATIGLYRALVAAGSVEGLGPSASLIARTSTSSSIEEFAKDIDLAKLLDAGAGAASDLKSQLQDVNAQFEEMSTRAARLGLDLGKVAEMQKVSIDAIVADALGQRYGGLAQLAQGLSVGAGSALSPAEQLFTARSQFGDIAHRAGLGEDAALGQVGAAGQQFLGLSQQYYGISPEFARDVDYVTRYAQAILDSAPSNDSVVRAIYESSAQARQASDKLLGELQMQFRELRQQFTRMGDALLYSKTGTG